MATGRENGRPADPRKALELPEIHTALEVQAMQFPEPRWAVPGILPEGLCLLCGAPKMGKSWMALGLCMAIAQGGMALGQIPVEQGDVLYLALEDRWRRLKSRMEILNPRGEWPERLSIATKWDRMGKLGLMKISSWLGDHPDARLVVIDTLAKIRRQSDRPVANQYADDYATGEAIKAVADNHGVAIAVVHHFRKMVSTDPLEQISGTYGLSGACDGVLLLQRQRGQIDAKLVIDGRDVDNQELALKWDRVLATWTLVGSAEDYQRSKEQQDIIKVLRESGQALSIKDVAGILRKSHGAVKKLLWTMAGQGKIRAVGDGRYLDLSRGEVDGELPLALVTGGNSSNRNSGTPLDASQPPYTPVGDSGSAESQSNRSNRELPQLPRLPGLPVLPQLPRLPKRAEVADCVDCGAELPAGWYFRCAKCEGTWVQALPEEV